MIYWINIPLRNEELEQKAKLMIDEDSEMLDNATYEKSEAHADK